MPSGTAHTRIEAALLVLLWTPAVVFSLIRGWAVVSDVLAFDVAYAFSMLFLSPDLDLRKSKASRRWGVLRWLWAPYALVFRHRRMSHHLLLGPLTRIGYLGILAVGGVLLTLFLSGRSVVSFTMPINLLFALLLGLYLPNLTHVLTDRLHSTWQQRKRL